MLGAPRLVRRLGSGDLRFWELSAEGAVGWSIRRTRPRRVRRVTTFGSSAAAGAGDDCGETLLEVVIVEMVSVLVVSLVVLLAVYGPYSRLVLGLAHLVAARTRYLGIFLAIAAIVPAALLLV